MARSSRALQSYLLGPISIFHFADESKTSFRSDGGCQVPVSPKHSALGRAEVILDRSNPDPPSRSHPNPIFTLTLFISDLTGLLLRIID